ncbi:unnamed protein product [Paramecium sonneborni]|uniref:Uncharacterized protein n=1 Tax=Paramecium sonneborni TaxID=65129 RepID=A0A8S1QZ41_9CILI|nr:unnamed protein product [Paramecium sonneborni]
MINLLKEGHFRNKLSLNFIGGVYNQKRNEQMYITFQKQEILTFRKTNIIINEFNNIFKSFQYF